jgi:hypothetical protein
MKKSFFYVLHYHKGKHRPKSLTENDFFFNIFFETAVSDLKTRSLLF